jgi:hypothetical protein
VKGGGGERERKRERGKKVSSRYYSPAGASTSRNNRGYSNPFHTEDATPYMGDLHRSNIHNPQSQCLVCEFAA